jgi:hypothetical protein
MDLTQESLIGAMGKIIAFARANECELTCCKFDQPPASTVPTTWLRLVPPTPPSPGVIDGTLRLVYCKSADMAAGALTKPLTGPEVNRLHGAFSVLRPIPHPAFAGPYGRIGLPLHNPGTFPLLSDV